MAVLTLFLPGILQVPAAQAQTLITPGPGQIAPLPAGPRTSQPAASQPAGACSAWSDNFDTGQLDPRWVVGSGSAPGYIANLHQGSFLPSHVSLANQVLSLQLTQQTGQVDTNPSGVISSGAMIQTNVACGYGTYEWVMRMSSTATCKSCSGTSTSGSVSAGFNYINNSQTEIDYEFSATNPGIVWLANWLNTNPSTDPTGSMETASGYGLSDVSDQFHYYRMVWSAGNINFYIDGSLIVNSTTNVPSAPAYFMITHWGADSTLWGGLATIGTPRYMYISHAGFAPASANAAPAITSATSTTFTAGVSGTFAVTAAGYPPPTFTETGALPSGVTLSSWGALSGTPAANTAGNSYPIYITATNGVLPDATQTFTLMVVPKKRRGQLASD